jgi:hypothetical protein
VACFTDVDVPEEVSRRQVVTPATSSSCTSGSQTKRETPVERDWLVDLAQGGNKFFNPAGWEPSKHARENSGEAKPFETTILQIDVHKPALALEPPTEG